jgi:hypothetical protein
MITGVQFHTIDVWQKTSRPRAGMRVQKQKKVANSVGIGPVFCFGRMSCCRLDSTFFVWIALFPKVIFYFGLSG